MAHESKGITFHIQFKYRINENSWIYFSIENIVIKNKKIL